MVADDDLERLRRDPATWDVDQELDIAHEVYDPKRPDIHELDDEELVERFRTLLGVDLMFDEPEPLPAPSPGERAARPDDDRGAGEATPGG